MRLTGLIIAALFAIAAGILTISAPHGRAPTGQYAVSTSIDSHGNHVRASTEMGHGGQSMLHDRASAQADCDPPVSGFQKGTGTECCNMGACHAVQVFAAPVIPLPFGSAVTILMEGDEQVEGTIPGGPDRPPRIV
ncbi:hypothetical protein [Microvirga mediterraneensis]|uniref:DUF2946 domain-containing protein n=1 Tax=Microvirga mediterraneensis TaxID=2754695 RepID=A0A838BTM6_9HYPH|nr:hypothetical protein [Microvirga mediterraneensis]MBA1158781.1 hypothetical protein [Microvirga mediterraneensis]